MGSVVIAVLGFTGLFMFLAHKSAAEVKSDVGCGDRLLLKAVKDMKNGVATLSQLREAITHANSIGCTKTAKILLDRYKSMAEAKRVLE